MATDLYFNDAATLDDGFGTTLAGDQVARMCLEVATPFTIGVIGKWGSGKTSVMRRAHATLKGRPVQLKVPFGEVKQDDGGEDWKRWRFDSAPRRAKLGWPAELRKTARQSLCVWFSPWQQQQAENPLVPLLLEIKSQYTTRLRVLETAKGFNRRGGLAGLALLERVIDAGVSLAAGRATQLAAGTSKAVREAWRDAAPAEPGLDDGQRFHLLFQDAIETALAGLLTGGKASSGRLIVFIDDLDRCEEAVVVQLLETLKLYLGSSRCVFVLGLDDSAVLAALGRQWQGRPDDANRDYLEKLFQAVVPVPLPRPGRVRRALTDQLHNHGFISAQECAAMILDIIEPNPRKLKNFLNAVCANWALYRASRPSPSDEPESEEEMSAGERFERRFVLFQYLRMYHNPIWRLLERQPWCLRLLTQVLTRGVEQERRLPDGVDPDAQRILEKVMFRAFAHVLEEDPRAAEDADPRRSLEYYDHIPLEDAVKLFQDRIDRKRSDEHFRRYYRGLIATGDDLPERFLYPHLPGDDPAE